MDVGVTAIDLLSEYNGISRTLLHVQFLVAFDTNKITRDHRCDLQLH